MIKNHNASDIRGQHISLASGRRLICGEVRFCSGTSFVIDIIPATKQNNIYFQGFDEGEFTGLNELSELYLGQNRIVFLSVQLQHLQQLQYLVVSHNKIRKMYAHQLPTSLKYLYVEGE